MDFRIICVLLILIMTASPCAFAINSTHIGQESHGETIIYVSDSAGNDSNSGLTLDKPKKTIKSAFDAASSGSVLKIAKGVYKGEKNSNITLSKNIKIQGESKEGVIIDAQGQSRIFIIPGKISVSITCLTMKNGLNQTDEGKNKIKSRTNKEDGSGGAILNKGSLSVEKCSFINNTADVGGAIYSANACNLNSCTFQENIAQSGGAVQCEGKGSIQNSNFTNNDALGGAAAALEGTFDVINCNFMNNEVEYNSAAVDTDGNVTVKNSSFIKNNGGALVNGGICTITGSKFDSNYDGVGSAIHNVGKLTVTKSSFIKNKGDIGGAICNVKKLTVNGCNFNENIARASISPFGPQSGRGGAIENSGEDAYLNIIHSTFIGNVAQTAAGKNQSSRGGAIYNELESHCSITGSSFTGNTASMGGVIYNENSKCVLNFNSMIRNNASKGKAIYNAGGYVNALNNWWGSNKGPTGLIQGKINAVTWLKLTIKANPTQVKKGKTSKITADLFTDSKGHNHKVEATKYPSLIPAIFKTTWGSITQNTLKSGVASVIFTANGKTKMPKYALVSVADKYSPKNVARVKINLI